MKIKNIETFWLDVPFHDVPDRNMSRSCHGWHIVEMCRVELDNGVVGMGETLPHYTWGKVSPKAIERAKGANPFAIMWDDTLGAGLQMAILDACGKAAQVPVHKLLGNQIRDWCPISWWGIDMSPEDYASETRDAVKLGYTSFKQKARPWWDVYEQARLTCAQADENFKLDFDFNELLNTAGTAISVIQELDKFPQIMIYESPIPQSDINGNRRIRRQTRCAIAMHYNSPPVYTATREEVTDGWVFSGGASGGTKAARWCDHVNQPFWLQLVGTAWTTTMAAHLGAVCEKAQWPAVTCMNMYVDQLITEPIEVVGGYYRVPDTPGLGIEFNEDALKFKVDKPDKPVVDAYSDQAIYGVVRANGFTTWYAGEFTDDGGYWPDTKAGNQSMFEHGVRLETWPNDGSKEWRNLCDRVKIGPVRESRQL